jgi:hypothetical protein
VACSPIFPEADCAETRLQTANSSDGKFIATLVKRDCGATTAYANIVFIKNSKDSFGRDGKWGDIVYVLQGNIPVSIEWLDGKFNITARASDANVFSKKSEWNGIEIVYK